MFKQLMEAFGPSGFEREASTICRDYMIPHCDEVIQDKLGSLVFTLRGSAERPHVLLAGHVDEIGFVVSSIDEKSGFLTFNPLGGWWDQVLLGQRVVVRTNKGEVPGIISSKPPHLLGAEERRKVVELKDMFIDVGCVSKEEAQETGVRIGDPVVPWSPLSFVQSGRVAMGKAFDDRVGAFVLMEAIKRLKEQVIEHPNTVYGAATVQEEVGLRGAQTTAHLVDPDVGLVLEVDIAGDVPGIQPKDAPARMGRGPTLLTYDRSMIPNQALKEFVAEAAAKAQIPLQLSQVSGGGTDAGRIHLDRSGCPSVVIGVPTRHIHSHVGLLSLKDVENAVRLIIELVKQLDSETVRLFTRI